MHLCRSFSSRLSNTSWLGKLPPSRRLAIIRAVFLFFLLLSLLAPGIVPVKAAIDLGSFQATARDGSVLIEWETMTEFDIAGFQVLRSGQENANFTEIGDFIPAEGMGVTGAQYNYTDEDVTNGVTYYYRLKAFDPSGNPEIYDQTISATPGSATPTPTPTQTQDPADSTNTSTPEPSDTPTLSPTPTDSSYPDPPTAAPPTPYPGVATLTPLPTSSGYPEPATRTPTRIPTQAGSQLATPTPRATATLVQTSVTASTPLTLTQEAGTPTATLVPFPTLTLEFPQTAVAVAPQQPRQLQGETTTQSGGSGLSRYIPLGFILLIWVLLGVWFYFSSRSLE